MVGALRSPAKREMAANNIVTTYASWDTNVDAYLRSEADDVYVRPLFSILDDDTHEYDDHKTCAICQTFDFGARWVPNNGGAWVNSSSWQASRLSVDKYLGMVDE